jgi:ABC-type uncharacterized transport system permease subunit
MGNKQTLKKIHDLLKSILGAAIILSMFLAIMLHIANTPLPGEQTHPIYAMNK